MKSINLQRLEMRIAKLERQAGVFDIPNTIARKIKSAFKDVLANLTLNLQIEKKLAMQVIASELENNILQSMDKSAYFDSYKYPELKEFDPKSPMDSLFEVDGKKYLLRNLPSHYDDPSYEFEGRGGIMDDVKAGFSTWYRQYGKALDLLNEDKDPTKAYNNFMENLKRYSKLGWRLISLVVNFLAIKPVIVGIATTLSLALNPNVSVYFPPNVLASGFLAVAVPVVIYKVMKLIEAAFAKKKVHLDMFDEMASKKAGVSSKFPISYSVATYLEKLNEENQI